MVCFIESKFLDFLLTFFRFFVYRTVKVQNTPLNIQPEDGEGTFSEGKQSMRKVCPLDLGFWSKLNPS